MLCQLLVECMCKPEEACISYDLHLHACTARLGAALAASLNSASTPRPPVQCLAPRSTPHHSSNRQAEPHQAMQPGEPEVGKPGHKGAMLWEAAPDIFEALTPFQPGLRSPCFRNRTDGALRCLPYFSIIGAPLTWRRPEAGASHSHCSRAHASLIYPATLM